MPPGPGDVRVSVVIPVYRDADRLSRSLPAVREYFDSIGADYEIIVVDDASRDGAREVSMRNGARFFSTSRRMGKGYCVGLGIREADMPWTLVTDADLSVPPREFERVWRLAEEGFPIVVGSRRSRGSRIWRHQPIHRRLASRAYHLVSSVLLPHSVEDPQCGFKLFHTETARRLLSLSRIRGYAFDTEMLFLARRTGVPVVEVGVEWSHDHESRFRIGVDSLFMLHDLLRARISHSLLSRVAGR